MLLRRASASSARTVLQEGFDKCAICFNYPLFFPKASRECTHRADVCRNCLREYIESHLFQHEAAGRPDVLAVPDDLQCPTIGCNVVITAQTIKSRMGAEIFERYHQELLYNILGCDSNYTQCINPECGVIGFINDGENNQFIICHRCRVKQCVLHRVRWHEGLSCDGYQVAQDKKKEDPSYTWILKNTKPCPGCQQRIEKSGGFNMITCRRPGGCGIQFCWTCLAPQTLIRQIGHYDNCAEYRGQPGAHPAPPLPSLELRSKALPPSLTRPAERDEECIVCMGTPEYFPRLPPSTNCTHEADICHDCLKTTIKTLVTSHQAAAGIGCPKDTCRALLSHNDVRKWADPDVFERFDQAVLLHTLSNEESFVRCLNVKCKAGGFHGMLNKNPRFTCYECGEDQCARDTVKWHEGLTCEQYRKKRETEIENLSHSWINEQTKPCPGPECKRRIQKNAGCDHMTCRKPAGCGFEFCWLCLAPYSLVRQRGNSGHYDCCTYYTGTAGGHPAPNRDLLPMQPLPELVGPIPDYPPEEKPEEESVAGPSNQQAPTITASNPVSESQTSLQNTLTRRQEDWRPAIAAGTETDRLNRSSNRLGVSELRAVSLATSLGNIDPAPLSSSSTASQPSRPQLSPSFSPVASALPQPRDSGSALDSWVTRVSSVSRNPSPDRDLRQTILPPPPTLPPASTSPAPLLPNLITPAYWQQRLSAISLSSVTIPTPSSTESNTSARRIQNVPAPRNTLHARYNQNSRVNPFLFSPSFDPRQHSQTAPAFASARTPQRPVTFIVHSITSNMDQPQRDEGSAASTSPPLGPPAPIANQNSRAGQAKKINQPDQAERLLELETNIGSAINNSTINGEIPESISTIGTTLMLPNEDTGTSKSTTLLPPVRSVSPLSFGMSDATSPSDSNNNTGANANGDTNGHTAAASEPAAGSGSPRSSKKGKQSKLTKESKNKKDGKEAKESKHVKGKSSSGSLWRLIRPSSSGKALSSA